MMLYSTITSERGKPATKGGNERMTLHLTSQGNNGNRIDIAIIRYEATKDGLFLAIDRSSVGRVPNGKCRVYEENIIIK